MTIRKQRQEGFPVCKKILRLINSTPSNDVIELQPLTKIPPDMVFGKM